MTWYMKIIHSAVYEKWGDPAASMIHPLLIQIQSRGNAGFCKTTVWQELSCQLLFQIIISWKMGRWLLCFHLLQLPSALLACTKGIPSSLHHPQTYKDCEQLVNCFVTVFSAHHSLFFFFQSISCPIMLMKFSSSTHWVSYSAGVNQHSFTEANRMMWVYTNWESGPWILRQTNNSQWIIYRVSFTWFSVYGNLWFILHSMQNCFSIFPWAKNTLDCRYVSLQVMATVFIVSWCKIG